jgi:hypothetical protein
MVLQIKKIRFIVDGLMILLLDLIKLKKVEIKEEL